ncbi:CaaX farnesyltransferase alpha subunit [Aureobasidium namibiae CBS 147.97]|uniref:Protein farnesyltransferase/geranylgeranyltransferase type-1 subunit alpha n=1 Tax=Aureobasidium namibiae CBS 147.97 TaxID=1043004 RepID=A0A074XU75_9PEZI
MGKYSDDTTWDDIVPLPQDDGGPNPLAAIAYTDEYSEAMSYLRAIMAKNEMSERALSLTEDIIDMNAAHYTVWLYRSEILKALDSDLSQELDWLNETALAHQKNYQIWHHRQLVVDRLNSCAGEAEFISQMFDLDAKNYHVWSYRQWLVRRFNLWDEGELEATEKLIDEDVRNNSAWNHRFFLVSGGEEPKVGDKAVVDREIEFAHKAIHKAPQNQSPWNYLRGILSAANLPISSQLDFVNKFATVDSEHENAVKSSHALDLLAEIYAVEKSNREKAVKAYDLLASKYDPIRANYWAYLKGQLGQEQAVA